MFFVSFILLLFIILFAIVITYLFIRIMRENKSIQDENNMLKKSLSDTTTKNKDIQARLDDLMSKPSAIGLSYKTNDPNIKPIFDNLRDIFQELQGASCPTLREQFLKNRQEFVDSLVNKIKSGGTTCSNIKSNAQSEIDTFAKNTSNYIVAQVPQANMDKLQTTFITIVGSVLTASCTNDTVDVKKVDQFLMDMFNAICYNK